MDLAALPIAAAAILVRRLMDILQRPQTVERAVVPTGRFTYAIIPLCLLYMYRYVNRGQWCSIVRDCSCRIKRIKGRIRECRWPKCCRRSSEPWLFLRGRRKSGTGIENNRRLHLRQQEIRPLCPPKLRHSAVSTCINNPIAHSEPPGAEPAEIPLQETNSDIKDEEVPKVLEVYATVEHTARVKKSRSCVRPRKNDSEAQSDTLSTPEFTLSAPVSSEVEGRPSAKELSDFYRNTSFEPSCINMDTPPASRTAFVNGMFFRTGNGNGSETFFIKKCRGKRKKKLEIISTPILASGDVEKKTTRSGHFYGYRM